MMDRKEKWIEETLNSLNNVGKPPLSPLLSEKLNHLAKGNSRHQNIDLHPFLPWVAAASIALLMGFNVLTALYYQESQQTSNNPDHPVYNEYFDYLNTFN
jgi:hypothetical protein